MEPILVTIICAIEHLQCKDMHQFKITYVSYAALKICNAKYMDGTAQEFCTQSWLTSLYSSLANHHQSQYQEYQIFHLFSILYCDDKVLAATSLLKSNELS